MKNPYNNRHRKLQRSTSGQKRKFSPMLTGVELQQNLRMNVHDANPNNYGGRLSTHKKISNSNIRNEYAIVESEEKLDSRARRRRLSQELKLRQIEKKHRNKIEQEVKMKRNQIRKRRSQGSLRSATNSSQGNQSNQVERTDSRSTRKIDQRRFVTMAIRSERYIRLSPQQKPPREQSESSKERQISHLEEQIEKYKKKYDLALKAVEKLSKVIEGQNSKHFLEKQIYQEKIRLLRSQLEAKNINKNTGVLGHIYYYKEFPQQDLLPESLILEQGDQSGESWLPESKRETVSRLVEEYANLPDSSSGIKSNLSIQSK